MAEQNHPANPQSAPDPANSYERSRPSEQPGLGRLDNNKGTPENQPDSAGNAVKNQQDPSRQINAHETQNRPAANQPDHSMHDEEPDGWDQAPTDIHDNRQKRHPRTEGRGGTP
jgi:hypothetical protein